MCPEAGKQQHLLSQSGQSSWAGGVQSSRTSRIKPLSELQEGFLPHMRARQKCVPLTRGGAPVGSLSVSV